MKILSYFRKPTPNGSYFNWLKITAGCGFFNLTVRDGT